MKICNFNWTSMIAAIILSTFFISCDTKQQETTEETEEMEHMEHMDSDQQQTAAVDTQGEPEFIVNYMNMKNAMVNDNYEQAKEAASKMENSLKQSQLNEEQRNNLMELSKQFSEAENIENQRLHFTELSHEVYKVVQENDVTDKTLYWAYCPMALDNGGGHWLSYEKEIQNPFMGQRMPKCGSVKETIN
ncbi:MAG: DUF3347 domain-containing protein [Candidatus Cyclobacteriaceae bacterium M2_1C_046]